MRTQTLTAPQIEATATATLAVAAAYLAGTTGVAYTAAELRSALRLALARRKAPRAILLWDNRRGLDVAPTLLPAAWAQALNELAEGRVVRPALLENAVSHALRTYSPAGGSLLAWCERGRVVIHVLGLAEVGE
jgi:hypothetical protein